ncbi:MAG TPA: hypothetical protein VMT30_05080 [Candidatus Saccharimonadia bacterium]|nr:hypothetical protein [Candidatus Saccharimonadia bacterium]
MKKPIIIISLAAAALAVTGVTAARAATAPAGETDITGIVTEFGVPRQRNATFVECKGLQKFDDSDAKGAYLVTFTAAECPAGSSVTVVAANGSRPGRASGTVRGITTKLKTAAVNVQIPGPEPAQNH